MTEGRPSFRLTEEKNHNGKKGVVKEKGAYATIFSAVHKEGIALLHAEFLIN